MASSSSASSTPLSGDQIEAIAAALAIALKPQLQQMVAEAVSVEVARVEDAINKRIATLGDEVGGHVSTINAVADRAAETSQLIDTSMNELANKLEMAKVELAGIRHPRANEDQLALAMFELDEIISATQAATAGILSAAEKIMDVVARGPDARITSEEAENLVNEITRIFEACNFQDLTGQRVTKVVDTFLKIEDHMNAIIRNLGKDSFDHIPVGEERHASRDGTVLTGPAAEKHGTSQNEIDALFD